MTDKRYTVSGNNPHLRFYQANGVVIQEDTPNDGSIYILEEGRLGVFKNGIQVSEISESGILFGEMAQVLQTPRTATIKTLTECRITVYPANLIQHLLDQLPAVARKILISMTVRLQHQTSLHAEDLLRTENLEKMNLQMRRRLVELTKQLEELKAEKGVPH